MRRKMIILLTVLLLSCSLVGCGSTSVNIKTEECFSYTIVGKNTMVRIGNGLYYDSSTGIVYWWNGNSGLSYSATTPTPYYAPNGLPYRYNPETNTFEEIEER